MTKFVNSLFQFFNLYIVYRIYKLLNIDRKEIILYILIIGFGYSSIRFGTENENYIIPITFSLLASYYYLVFIKSNSLLMVFLSGFFASIACLFHQIHFFWWLGILIGIVLYIKKKKIILIYSISALIVPITYLLVIYFYNNETLNTYNIFHFVFHDYYSGTAKSEFGVNNFIFTFISSIRTFFQIHPVIISLIKENYFFSIPILTLPLLFFVFIKLLFRKKMFSINKTDNKTTIFIKTHIIIFFLHFIFSFYAVGNVGFMVMLPFLMFLSIFYFIKINYYFLKIFAITLIIWNFSFGLIANNMFNFYNEDVLVDFIINHPNEVFIINESTVLNQYSYKTGDLNVKNIKQKSSKNTIKEIKSIKYFYTDIINKPKILNRASILEKHTIDFSKNKKELIKTYQGLFGKSYIYKVYLD